MTLQEYLLTYLRWPTALVRTSERRI